MLAGVSSWQEKHPRRLKRLIDSGVPLDLRAWLWSQLLNVDQLKEGYFSHKGGVYSDNATLSGDVYFEHLLSCKPSGHTLKCIERDVPRTFPNHVMFKQESSEETLQRVLWAYAIHDPELGYVVE
jgi:hypothetical protein